MRHRLIPYLYAENYKYHKTGLPLVQPLYYSYPEIYDEPIYKNEYYFGSELLVKPITKKQDTVMNRCVEQLFLPKGTWYDFKTGIAPGFCEVRADSGVCRTRSGYRFTGRPGQRCPGADFKRAEKFSDPPV